jgi:hypothetical protein
MAAHFLGTLPPPYTLRCVLLWPEVGSQQLVSGDEAALSKDSPQPRLAALLPLSLEPGVVPPGPEHGLAPAKGLPVFVFGEHGQALPGQPH